MVENKEQNTQHKQQVQILLEALKKHLKDNKKTISDLVYELTQAKLKIKQLTGE